MGRRLLAVCLGVGATLIAPPTARGQGTTPRPAVVGRPVAAASQDPAPGWPLPTDGLMAPAAPVPPRSAFQRPPAPPVPQDVPGITLPSGMAIPVPDSVARMFRVIPRYGGRRNQITHVELPDGTHRFVITGGLIVNVAYPQAKQEIEFSTDNAVLWARGKDADRALGGFETNEQNKTEVELYMTGNVVIRTRGEQNDRGSRVPIAPTIATTIANTALTPTNADVTQTVRADEVYYDVERNRAIATSADLEVKTGGLPDAVHLKGTEVWRLGRDEWRIIKSEVAASKTPSDPGLAVRTREATLTEREAVLTNVFGLPYRDLLTGEKIRGVERTISGRNATIEVADVPVFWLPYFKTDAAEPLGPFVGFSLGQDRVFGTQVYTTWDMYKVLALRPPPGHRWRVNLDYLSDRGPAAGTDYTYTIPNADPTLPLAGRGSVRMYGIQDDGVDILGGFRGPEPLSPPPGFRGRATWQHLQEIAEGWHFQGQASLLSDKNFLEQYYKLEFDQGPNQETFAYLSHNRGNLWASGLVEGRVARNWVTETNWLPRVDGAVIGQDFFDLFSYSARGSAGYAQLMPDNISPFPVVSTDLYRVNTGRFDIGQELSLPFDLGPLKVVPYGTLDLTQYTEDIPGNSRGRVIGGGGARAALPFSHLYADAYSELFNVRGLYHKGVLSANYYMARSDTPFSQLPQLDRLYDDATDQAVRNIVPLQPGALVPGGYVPGTAGILLSQLGNPNNQFNPQRYAIRRLVENRVDTRDTIDVLQTDLRQRWQTKRGYPGLEHVVDAFTLDMSASYFPNANRDNFGNSWAFLEYGALWNVGDRVALTSNGWFDPFDDGVRYYNIGANLNRPDGTNFYLGYRQTDPLRSKAVTASVGYQLSPRYYANLGATYDFGIQAALTNYLTLTRTGTDLTFTFGVTYNALVNNFGVQFLVIPNLVALASPGRFGATSLSGR